LTKGVGLTPQQQQTLYQQQQMFAGAYAGGLASMAYGANPSTAYGKFLETKIFFR
jgi:hypothetical protein